MNIVMVKVKTNRFYRRQMNQFLWVDLNVHDITDDEWDDLDNMYSGCAFE